MKKFLFYCLFISQIQLVNAQSNIHVTNTQAENILRGNYNPADYTPAKTSFLPKDVVASIHSSVSPDSLKNILFRLQKFGNRNTASDTLSNLRGIGAVRRWIYSYFEKVSADNENRLIPSYLSFRQNVCSGEIECRNIMAILPGTDTSDKSVIILEAHVDSRCEDACDTACVALGMEDNGSGTAMVMELVRSISKYSFKNTIAFVITIGEEQGLYGATALAQYCQQKKIQVKAVQNNDVVGGIICGKTSSPPSCPGLNDIDSTHVRLFSYGKNLSPHKSFARYMKLEYTEELKSMMTVPMQINIMNADDRTGRGGDHKPFWQLGYTAIRMTSANENGDANPVSGYTDRQHSVRDLLGVDRNQDSLIDSFFVDFNYLSRNTMINGVSAVMAAMGVKTPVISTVNDSSGITVNITSEIDYPAYKIGIRTISNDFNVIYKVDTTSYKLPNITKDSTYFISVAAVDTNEVESLFSDEKMVKAVIVKTGIAEKQEEWTSLELLPVILNADDETTTITIKQNGDIHSKNDMIRITDVSGKIIKEIPLHLKSGLNEVIYEHGYNATGIYFCSLWADGKILKTEKMILVK